MRKTKGRSRTPTLREVSSTASYIHDGRFRTLEEVVSTTTRAGSRTPYLDGRRKPLNLTTQDKKDLAAFLHALSGKGWQGVKAPREYP